MNKHDVEREGPDEDFSEWVWKSTEVENLYNQIRLDAARTVMDQIEQDIAIQLETKDDVLFVCVSMFEYETQFRTPLSNLVEYFIETRALPSGLFGNDGDRAEAKSVISGLKEAVAMLRATLPKQNT